MYYMFVCVYPVCLLCSHNILIVHFLVSLFWRLIHYFAPLFRSIEHSMI